jgi:LacI family transcriptional regulator
LNGNTKNFSPKTIDKVQKIKDEMNYEADYFARRMVMKESKTIGVMVPDITNPFFSTLVKGIEDVLYKENFITMLCNVDRDDTKESIALEELSRRGVDGFIIASSAISTEAIDKLLRKKKHPFIILDQKSFEDESDTIGTDDFNGGKLAGEHLKELGHKEVVVVVPSKMTVNIQNRLKGFQSIYSENITILETSLSKEGGKKIDKKIPEDYSIIGYDNVDMCEYVSPTLTTIAQPIYELGQQTAEMLLKRINEPTEEWHNKKLPVNIIKRFSTTHA